MSLWKVDDEATKDFMIKLYSEYLSSNNIDDAFKKTQLYIKQKHKSPYYWGAFVMVKGYKG